MTDEKWSLHTLRAQVSGQRWENGETETNEGRQATLVLALEKQKLQTPCIFFQTQRIVRSLQWAASMLQAGEKSALPISKDKLPVPCISELPHMCMFKCRLCTSAPCTGVPLHILKRFQVLSSLCVCLELRPSPFLSLQHPESKAHTGNWSRVESRYSCKFYFQRCHHH